MKAEVILKINRKYSRGHVGDACYYVIGNAWLYYTQKEFVDGNRNFVWVKESKEVVDKYNLEKFIDKKRSYES